jgi:hypothetical protein
MVLAMGGGAAYSGLTGANAAATGGASAGGTTGGGSVGGAVGGSTGGGLGTTSYGLTSGGGLGLQAPAGTGLSLTGSLTGAPGMTAGVGEGLTLAGSTGGLGLSEAVAGNALLEGAGLNPASIAHQTGTALTGSVLNGTTTLADGSVVQTGGGVPAGSGGGTPATTTPRVPAVPGTGGGAPTGGGLGGLNLGPLIDLLTGIYGGNQQGEAADRMLEWLQSRTAITDNMYAEGSPERLRMQQEMDRKDAAAGRNSQYGTRAVDLASNIAKIKSAENTRMTTGIGQWMQGAYNQDASRWAGLSSALGGLFAGGAGGAPSWFDQLIRGVTGGAAAPVATTPTSGGGSNPVVAAPSGGGNQVSGGAQEPAVPSDYGNVDTGTVTGDDMDAWTTSGDTEWFDEDGNPFNVV